MSAEIEEEKMQEHIRKLSERAKARQAELEAVIENDSEVKRLKQLIDKLIDLGPFQPVESDEKNNVTLLRVIEKHLKRIREVTREFQSSNGAS